MAETQAQPQRLLPTHLSSPVPGSFIPDQSGTNRSEMAQASRAGYHERLRELMQAPQLAQLLKENGEKRTPEQFIGAFQRKVKTAQALRQYLRSGNLPKGQVLENLVDISGDKRAVSPENHEEMQSLVNTQKTVEAHQAALQEIAKLKHEIRATLATYGKSFEYAYRIFLKEQATVTEFAAKLRQVATIRKELRSAQLNGTLDDDHALSLEAQARVNSVFERGVKNDPHFSLSDEELGDLLITIYGDPDETGISSEEKARRQDQLRTARMIYTRPIHEDLASITGQQQVLRNAKELTARKRQLEAEIKQQWEGNSALRQAWLTRERLGFVRAYTRGDAVIETQSVKKLMNELADIEASHTNTIIGAALVGEPGVGKSTVLRHYLEREGRQAVYIDLSGDVTRYMLFGSPKIELQGDEVQKTEAVIDKLQAILDKEGPEGFQRFLESSTDTMLELMQATRDFAEYRRQHVDVSASREVAQQAVIEQLIRALSTHQGLDREKAHKAVDIVVNHLRTRRNEELAKQATKLLNGTQNGWKDGILIHALRKGYDVILDEFTHKEEWTELYDFLQTHPGGEYVLADNSGERIRHKRGKIWFTANIGSKHGGFQTPEALASRIGGQVIEVKAPPATEEESLLLAAITSPEGILLRSDAALGGRPSFYGPIENKEITDIHRLAAEVLPAIRAELAKQPAAKRIIPVSMRSIRQLGEKLIRAKDPNTGLAIYRPNLEYTLDRAVYEVFVRPYALYTDKSLAKSIANTLLQFGFLTSDPTLKGVLLNDVGVGEEEYDKKCKAWAVDTEKVKATYQEAYNELTGRNQAVAMAAKSIPTLY